MSENITFDLVDDILCLDAQQQIDIVRAARVQDLGPLIEFVFHDHVDRVGRLEAIPACIQTHLLGKTFDAGSLAAAVNPINSFANSVEFIPTPQVDDEVLDPKWAAFLLRAQQAAEASGMSKPFALAVVGTLEEMVDNVLFHSQASNTGIVGYQTSRGSFEYVVADAGIGVLESLRKNPEFAYLEDPLEALAAALESGTTSMPGSIARGTGFNALLRNIAKNNCDLRFHTSSACITFEGIQAFLRSQQIVQNNMQAPPIEGFSISVVCCS